MVSCLYSLASPHLASPSLLPAVSLLRRRQAAQSALGQEVLLLQDPRLLPRQWCRLARVEEWALLWIRRLSARHLLVPPLFLVCQLEQFGLPQYLPILCRRQSQ